MAEVVQQQDGPPHSGSSNSTIDNEEYKKNVERVDLLLAEARALQLAESHSEAAEKFADAAELACTSFGQFAAESFFPNYLYGKTLIEVARKTLPAFKTGMEAIDEEEDDEDIDEQTEDVQAGNIDEKCERPSELEKNYKMEEDVERQADTIEKSDVEKDNKKEENMIAKPEEEGEQKEEETEEETDDDIELAWEVLEIARKICEKMIDEEQSKSSQELWLERKSDIQVSLGDCMTVAEEFGKAIEEFNTALEIRKRILPANDRRIAEVYYFIGLAQRNLEDYVKAADSFQLAKDVLQAATEKINKNLEEKSESVQGEGEDQKELEELKGIVAEIETNIQDARESAKDMERKLAEMMTRLPEIRKLMPEHSASDAASMEVNDITSMIRKKSAKRPLEEIIVGEEGNKGDQQKGAEEKGAESKGEEVTNEGVGQPERKKVKADLDKL